MTGGSVVAFGTGGDGFFSVRITGKKTAPPSDAVPFRLEVGSGSVTASSGSEEFELEVPNGAYRASAWLVEKPRPTFVVYLEKGTVHPTPRKRLDSIEPKALGGVQRG